MSEAWSGRQAAADGLRAAHDDGYGLPDGAQAYGDHSEDALGGGNHEPGVTRTVRTSTYRGRELRVETTYRVTIDGQPLAGHLEVLDDGMVHYHGLPQYAVASAVEMLQRVVDYFGSQPPVQDELGPAIRRHEADEHQAPGHQGHEHQGHEHEGPEEVGP